MLIFVKSSKLSICFICIQFLTNRTYTDAIVIVVVSNKSCIYEINTKKKDTKCQKTSNCNVNRTKSWNRKTVRSFIENSIRFELDLDLTRFQYTCMNTNAQHKCVFMSRWELFFYSLNVLVFSRFFFGSPFSFSPNNLRNSPIFLLVDDLKCFCDCAFSFYFISYVCTFDGENNIWLTVATIHFSKKGCSKLVGNIQNISNKRTLTFAKGVYKRMPQSFHHITTW